MIALSDVAFRFDNTEFLFNLQIQKGEHIALVGKSGAGKSTLLNLMAGFLLPQRGQIWLNAQNHSNTAPYLRPVSMLFQEHNLFNHLTCAQNMLLGLQPHLKATAHHYAQIEEIAQHMDISALLDRTPEALSGGQKQRVALARTLLRDKPILLLDEPFSALDPQLRSDMLTLISTISQTKQLTVVMVTHQLREVEHVIDRTLVVENGKIR
ncbi:thiamine ABC transporter ATP-binding protein [Spirabiliibacterium falconis]|uniref:thiamine ABC transporter ATP-binding protein n=1 Tax=Spirabiliibacterium falconis TaxID=572023 RepID=UPI001AAC6301|nr:thiamine ABC transporter ATP-binding protein [Spirabiliibacterium falconis]MBE2895207.1 thiamine ABC transporter ATP-binding protein [Spirabiliibacterium falconis]